MKLSEQTVAGFTGLLASDAPAPGGGSVAALEGAFGAALTAMVCALTAGREKYAAHQALIADVQKRAEALRPRLLEVMDRDTEAFLTVSAAFALPKGTEEEKAARSQAIQRGLELCTEVPLEGMELAGEALELAEQLHPDVVLTDIKMPFMDGLELCRHLRQSLPGAQLVVFSGFDDFEYARQAVGMGVSEYILKPINAAELMEVLAKVRGQLDRQRLERAPAAGAFLHPPPQRPAAARPGPGPGRAV